MKPQIGITIIVLIFLGAFLIYSRLPGQPGPETNPVLEEQSQANIGKSLGAVRTDTGAGEEQTLGTMRTGLDVDMQSAGGLDEELRGIIEGFEVITDELESLEKAPTTLAQ
jgi:hypothetical protein